MRGTRPEFRETFKLREIAAQVLRVAGEARRMDLPRDMPGETVQKKLIFLAVGARPDAVHAQGPAFGDMASHKGGYGPFVLLVVIAEEGVAHVQIVHDDRLLVAQNPPHETFPRRDGHFLNVRLPIGGRKRHRIIAGLIGQKEHGAVCVEGGPHQSQKSVVAVMKRCHESLFPR